MIPRLIPAALTDQPIVLPWGPVGIMVSAIVVGFVLLTAFGAFIAWQKGERYEAPARDFVALMIVIGFFSVVAYTFLGHLNEGGDILLGALIAAFSAVVTLYFRTKDGEKL